MFVVANIDLKYKIVYMDKNRLLLMNHKIIEMKLNTKRTNSFLWLIQF